MKYCSKCGTALIDEANFCTACGTAVTPPVANPVAPAQAVAPTAKPAADEEPALRMVAKIFMLISTVFLGLWIIPLAWCIPMTVIYFSKCDKNEQVGIGFKVCSLIFVSQVAGILMLVDQK